MASVKEIIQRLISPFVETEIKRPSGNGEIKISNEFSGYTGGQYRPFFSSSFNGEKNLGEIGPLKSYIMDYEALRLRSWKSYVDSEITQTVINKFITWQVGKGGKLQSEPAVSVLESEGIKIDKKFSQKIEDRFALYADSKYSDYSQRHSLNYIERVCLLNALVGGDVLVICRYENDCINVQLVDATHIISPGFGTEWYPQVLPNGNRIENGVEITPTGEHAAYHVRVPGLVFSTQRVAAKTEDGLTVAFLVYGLEHRLDNVRGIPLISTVMETLAKMERYKEATLGSAEERAKIILQVVHLENASGESPFTKQMAKAHDYDYPNNDNLPVDDMGKNLANDVIATTNKQVFNMPQGSEMKALEAKNELYFKDFYSVNIDLICACLGIPPDVAMSKYNENFSASRAALKDWEHTLNVRREEFAAQFKKKVYTLWLHVEILKNNIQAPGYLKAFMANNWMVLEAYRKARFTGAAVPHIDPLKEVQAERAKLGDTGLSIPLTTAEAATEALNGGDSEANMEQYAEELAKSKTLKIELPMPLPPAAPSSNGKSKKPKAEIHLNGN